MTSLLINVQFLKDTSPNLNLALKDFVEDLSQLLYKEKSVPGKIGLVLYTLQVGLRTQHIMSETFTVYSFFQTLSLPEYN